jgi:predicted lipid-binding transport protein (Tim44 family)
LALLTSFFVAGFALIPEDAEARRLGGARNMGAQRQVTPPPPKAAPAQQQTQQQAAPASNAANPAAAQPARSRWMAPVAGLAAGLGLGWLLTQGGFGALLSALLIALLVGVAVFALLRFFVRPRPQNEPVQYAGMARGNAVAPPPSQLTGGGSAGAPVAAASVPAGFDVAGFLNQAKLNFLHLQQANDQGDLETLREVTTEEMFQALTADVASRSSDQQPTEISGLEARLLEVTTEGDAHWASISFQGMIREDGGLAAPFQEIWHLRKPVTGDSGWLLAGIQQPG